MTDLSERVTAGVDAHADSHHAAVLDARGRLVASEAFPATRRGYVQLGAWLEAHGAIDAVGVESTGSYAAALVRSLQARGLRVVEVNQRHPHARQRRGKSDPLDAELAARAVQSRTATAVPKCTTGIVEAIRVLRVARDGAVKARTAALGQLHDLVLTAPAELREQLTARRSLKGKTRLCARLRPDATSPGTPLQAAKLALRSLAGRIAALDEEIRDLDRRLAPLVAQAAPRTGALLGVATGHAGQLLVTAGQNIDRLTHEAAFAALCAASPLPASSGRTQRHRLNYGGDRQANRALHLIAVCRLRYCPRTQAYATRRQAEGLSKPEIIRCLKRYIAREIYYTLRADLAALAAGAASA
jgi:transposase